MLSQSRLSNSISCGGDTNYQGAIYGIHRNLEDVLSSLDYLHQESKRFGVLLENEPSQADPAIDAVKALARAHERHKELCDNWETRCEAGQERPKAIDDALHEWEDLQLTLAQTPAKTMLGALAKADFLAMWAEDGDIKHHKALCRSIREDYAVLRKEASHG